MPTFGWYLVGVAAAAFVLMMIVAFSIQIADTSNPQKAPFRIIRIASFFGMLAAGLVLLLVFLGVPDVNKGKPATSLEPGTYYVHDVVWSSANNTDGYPSATFLLDEQPPGERGESLSEPVSVGKNLKLVQLKIYEFLIELECGSDGYCDAVPGWYELESVTRCTDSFCATRLEFTRLTEKKH